MQITGDATRKAMFLPGTFGGGPVPTSNTDVVSGWVVGHIRDSNINEMKNNR